MNRRTLYAVALRFACAWLVQGLTFAASPNDKGPETSADPTFQPEKVPKLALIVDRGGNGNRGRFGGFGGESQSDDQRLVEDEFVQVLLGKGYSVVSRSDMQAILKEQRFQRSGLTEGDAAAIGKLLNVPAVLVVRVTEVKTDTVNSPKRKGQVTIARAAMGARLVGVETGSIWWIGKYSREGPVANRNDTGKAISFVANAIAKAFPDRNPPKAADPPDDPKPAGKTTKKSAGSSGKK